ncbi:hypothetical protein [Xylanimonas sp. McL0601]|uniref:hypothetical protein n=1 Tax=Xylanimonas sp. McL0601 TaxID=3414739 RepID=UPI003CF9A95D
MRHTIDAVRLLVRHPVRLSVAVAVALATVQLLAVAPFTAGDEVAHLDYAWQVWHGGLPVFEDGLQLRPEHAWIPAVQWTSQHPPLFYLVLAPVVGPLADAGHAVGAMYAARALGALLAGVFVLVTTWAARGMVREGSRLPAVVAFVTACSAVVAQTAGTVLNDLFAAVWTTALLGLAVRVARRGLTWPLFAGLVGTATACALARTSSLIVAAVGLAGAALAALAHRQVARTAALTGTVVVVVAAASGWFYLRNLRLTGSVTGGHPDWALENQGRHARSLLRVAIDPVTWDRLPNLWWWGPVVPRPVGTVLLMAVPLVVGIVVHHRVLRRPLLAALPVAVPVAACVVAAAVQLAYATSGGGIYPRYLLPAALPLVAGVAAGLAHRAGRTRRWARWWLPEWVLPGWTAVIVVDLVTWLVSGRGGSAGAAMTSPPTTPLGYPAHTGAAWVAASIALGLVALACAAVVRTLVRPPRADGAAPATPRGPARRSPGLR